ncbi:MAG: S1 RNA-binding domain-containing protein [Eubacteriales bacterium]|nr:S1 RNA-binding domain-containing protein [Eubacteriales bacterium]
MVKYKPEGSLINTLENKMLTKSISGLMDAQNRGIILEAKAASCSPSHDLLVNFGFCKGLIPKEDCAIGIKEGTTKDIAIISRVNKPVCFKVTDIITEDGVTTAMLSRRAVQEECIENYISHLIPGDIITARITHTEPFGCFADIGCGISSLLPIDCISVSRITHPMDRLSNGQFIKAAVKFIDENGRITLTHKELLGTWEENASMFQSGETVSGIIRSVESYGVFVELTPNLAGLAEMRGNVAPGQQASVYIKSLIPEKMKIKLIIVDSFDEPSTPEKLNYYIDDDHIDYWRYSPECCNRVVETVFGETPVA